MNTNIYADISDKDLKEKCDAKVNFEQIYH
jgi:hypothetical protein